MKGMVVRGEVREEQPSGHGESSRYLEGVLEVLFKDCDSFKKKI